MATQLQLIVDDTDTQLTYSPGWTLVGTGNEFQHSCHETESDGATFTFKFNGTGITVFGTVDGLGQNGPPNSTYTLNGGEPQLFNGPRVQAVAYHQVFFQSPILPNTEHTIVGACKDTGSRIFLDYLVVTSPAPEASSGATQVTITMTATQAPSAQSTWNTQNQDASSHSNTSVGLVIGVAVSSFAFVMVTIAIILLYRRRVQSRNTDVPHFAEPAAPSTMSGSYYARSFSEPLSLPGPSDRSMEPPGYMHEFGGRLPIGTSGKQRVQPQVYAHNATASDISSQL